MLDSTNTTMASELIGPCFGWHWLRINGNPAFPAKWEHDHWLVHGLYCDRKEAAQRGYQYIALYRQVVGAVEKFPNVYVDTLKWVGV